jgi:hypothetical protein
MNSFQVFSLFLLVVFLLINVGVGALVLSSLCEWDGDLPCGDFWDWFAEEDEITQLVYLEIWPVVLLAHTIEQGKKKK